MFNTESVLKYKAIDNKPAISTYYKQSAITIDKSLGEIEIT